MDVVDSPAVLLLDLPPAALAGIGLLSFTATPKFRGIKHLPPGYHFAFVGSSTAFSERHGVWFEILSTTKTPHTLVVTKWDPATETLQLVNDEAEILRWRANLGSLWREGLAPYRQQAARTTDDGPQQETSDWPPLTSSITHNLLSRITGGSTHSSWHLSSASSAKADLEAIPGLSTSELHHPDNKELHFLPIDLRQTWAPGATGRERTEAAQDRSWALDNLIQHHCTHGAETEVLGELQFTFLMVLTLNNFSSLEQWKRLLTLLLTSKAAVPQRPDLFVSALAALRLQLQHCADAEGGGLIDLSDEGGSLLKSLLVRFHRGLDALGPRVGDVVDELDDLEDWLHATHGWRFGGAFARAGLLELEDGEQVRMDTTAFDAEDETGEFAPLVVELTPLQARSLGVATAGGGAGGDGGGGSLQDVGWSPTASRGDREVVQSDDGSSGESDGGGSSGEQEEMDELDDMDARF